METETKRKFYVAVDTWGYPYGDAHESRQEAVPDARACANLAPGADGGYACAIAQVYAESAKEALEFLHDRAVVSNS